MPQSAPISSPSSPRIWGHTPSRKALGSAPSGCPSGTSICNTSQEAADHPWCLPEHQFVGLPLLISKQAQDLLLVFLHGSQGFLARDRVKFLLSDLPLSAPLFPWWEGEVD